MKAGSLSAQQMRDAVLTLDRWNFERVLYGDLRRAADQLAREDVELVVPEMQEGD